jgi:prepilin-type N-terminal cleavage/methylation domain-containing protein
MLKKTKAFTLVELSIVLIVIGVLTGMVLKGQEVIRSAKLKRIMSDFSNVSTAIYTYEDRYDQLPGDDGSSVISTSLETLGNEDGIISPNESSMVMRHLRKAGILTGDSDDSSLNHALNGKIFVVQGSASGKVSKITEKNMPRMAGTAVCFDTVKIEDAQLLDYQNDDGASDKGTLQSSLPYKYNDKLVTICIKI